MSIHTATCTPADRHVSQIKPIVMDTKKNHCLKSGNTNRKDLFISLFHYYLSHRRGNLLFPKRQKGFEAAKCFKQETLPCLLLTMCTTCGGPKVLAFTTTTTKCDVKTRSGRQDGYIMQIYLKLTHSKKQPVFKVHCLDTEQTPVTLQQCPCSVQLMPPSFW